MDERVETSGRWPLLRAFLKVVVSAAFVGGLLFGASVIVRSEWFLRARIDPKLERMGERLHGDFSYESVSPVGFTGVHVEGLTFVPDGVDGVPIYIEELMVYPDLASILTGDLEARSIEVRGMVAEFSLDGGAENRGHWPWIDAVVASWHSRVSDFSGQEGGEVDESSFPEIIVRDSRVALTSPGGTMPEVGLSVDEVRLNKVEGSLTLDGGIHVDGLGYALLNGDASRRTKEAGMVVELVERPDLLAVAPRRDKVKEIVGEDSKLELSAVSVHWPPMIVFHDVRLTDTHIGVPGQDTAFIEEIGAETLRLAFVDQRADLRVSELDANVRLGLGEHFTTQVPLRLPLLDVLVDFGERKIGAGFSVGEEGETLSLDLAIDLEALDLALALDAQRFDAGPLLNFVPYTGPLRVTEGVVDGHVSMRYPLKEGLIDVRTFLTLSKLSFSAPWLSSEVLRDAEMVLDLSTLVDVHEERLTVREGVVSLGQAELEVSGEVQRAEERGHVVIEAKVVGKSLSGETLLEDLPDGFAPALEGYQLAGTLDVDLALELDTSRPEEMALDYALNVEELEVKQFGPRADIPLLAGDDFAVRLRTASEETLIGPTQSNWTPYFRIPRFVPASLVAAEDGRFYRHQGLDGRAIVKSIIANLKAGRFVRGASTITQQVAKNLFLGGQKTIARKVQEAFLAWQLEEELSKERIIEIYMNLAHWGPDVYGIKGASRYYFRKRPGELTVREALFLSSILPSPVRFGREYAEGYIRADRLEKMKNGLYALHRRGYVDAAAYQHHLTRLRRASVSNSPRPKAEKEERHAQLRPSR